MPHDVTSGPGFLEDIKEAIQNFEIVLEHGKMRRAVDWRRIKDILVSKNQKYKNVTVTQIQSKYKYYRKIKKNTSNLKF